MLYSTMNEQFEYDGFSAKNEKNQIRSSQNILLLFNGKVDYSTEHLPSTCGAHTTTIVV